MAARTLAIHACSCNKHPDMARPRSFDEEEVVNTALQLFIKKGYDGTSIADLTAAMGINPASLYAAFGDKRGLFMHAMHAYATKRAPLVAAALAQPTALQMVEHLLHGYADALTEPGFAPGCLYVQGALSCSEAARPVRDELARRRLAIEPELEARFTLAREEGELAPDADCCSLARYVAALLQGMAVQAASGATSAELHELADLVIGQFQATLRQYSPAE